MESYKQMLGSTLVAAIAVILVFLMLGAFKLAIHPDFGGKALEWAKSKLSATPSEYSYEIFLNDLEKECPYYEPNGARYRECLLKRLEQRERDAEVFRSNFIIELKTNTDAQFAVARDSFITDLNALAEMHPGFRDTKCMTEADKYGGSDQGGILNTCRLYETERYFRGLKELREGWFSQI